MTHNEWLVHVNNNVEEPFPHSLASLGGNTHNSSSGGASPIGSLRF